MRSLVERERNAGKKVLIIGYPQGAAFDQEMRERSGRMLDEYQALSDDAVFGGPLNIRFIDFRSESWANVYTPEDAVRTRRYRAGDNNHPSELAGEKMAMMASRAILEMESGSIGGIDLSFMDRFNEHAERIENGGNEYQNYQPTQSNGPSGGHGGGGQHGGSAGPPGSNNGPQQGGSGGPGPQGHSNHHNQSHSFSSKGKGRSSEARSESPSDSDDSSNSRHWWFSFRNSMNNRGQSGGPGNSSSSGGNTNTGKGFGRGGN